MICILYSLTGKRKRTNAPFAKFVANLPMKKACTRQAFGGTLLVVRASKIDRWKIVPYGVEEYADLIVNIQVPGFFL